MLRQYPEVTLDHLYVDNAAMQMVKRPDSFDVLVTENLFGDILSDEMAMISGSLGMLPSASLGEVKDNGLYFGMYEPSGGSAPDIAGQGIANPIAQILSVSMMLRYSLGETIAANAIDTAAQNAIDLGLRTGDLFTGKNGETRVNTIEMGNAILGSTLIVNILILSCPPLFSCDEKGRFLFNHSRSPPFSVTPQKDPI